MGNNEGADGSRGGGFCLPTLISSNEPITRGEPSQTGCLMEGAAALLGLSWGPSFQREEILGPISVGLLGSFLPHLSGCPLHLCPASSDSQTGVRSSSRHEPLLGLIFKTLFTSKPLSEMWFCPGEGVAVAFRTDVTPFQAGGQGQTGEAALGF